MTHAKALRVSFAAIFTCGLLVALVTLPFAALPVAYIGLTLGLTAAAVTTGLASVLLGALAGPGTALSFIISFGVPILWLIRLALLSRRPSLDADYEFYPAARIILQAVIISAALAAVIFLVNADVPQGLPGMFAKSLQKAPQVSELIRTVYGTDTNLLGVANIILITGFASWPLILLGTLQCAKRLPNMAAISAPPKRMTSENADLVRFCAGSFAIGRVGRKRLAGHAIGCICSDSHGAYFLLGLAVIHAIPATGMVVSGFWRGFIS